MVDANKTVKAKPDAKLKRAAKGMGTAPGKGLKSRLADGFVMMAMALVALALCLGLVLQGGLSFWLSVTVSLALYAGLLTTHALVRRAGQIEELRAELDRLKSDVARIGAAGDRLAGASDAVPAAPKSVPAGPATAAAPVHATHPGAGSGSNQAGIAVPQRPAASGSAMALHPRAGEPGVAAHMRGGAAAAPNTMDEPRGMGAPLPALLRAILERGSGVLA